MLHPIYFLPTLYTDTDMSIFGMVIVLAFQIWILLMGFTASFSSGPQLYESWHEFPIDLLYKDVSSLDTKWRHGQKFEDPPCPNSQYIGTLIEGRSSQPVLGSARRSPITYGLRLPTLTLLFSQKIA